MARAPREDQLQLLDVAELDAQLARLRSENENHPLRGQVGALMNEVAAKALDVTQAREAFAQAEQAYEKAAAKSAELSGVVKEKKDRLNAGIGMDSRELMTLQSEIDTNEQMLDEAFDAEFAALEQVEHWEAEITRLSEEQSQLNGAIVAGRAELEAEIEQIERDAADIRAQRDALYEPLAEPLKKEYERAVARGGLSVIALHPSGRTSGGVQLSPIEVNYIKNADPDNIHISDDYQCIVVLTDV
ncbi:zinc ribbon domain-containing protein [Trueperella bialowiezensis]|uniref:CT398-like coiled coil hairpin domain-containing protein n=1 Tax=Trueperella bialowiezensis TaxID=312285 RepID=A0A448PCI3_9ACTO|nr:hypothetical protein [Trueperella bialowiezensis]VEI12552.1 Uncharacterised protein [Trueperella bialowiezensis]